MPRARVGATHWVQQRPEPLYDTRLGMVATWAPTAGVAVGLAQGALDALVALADRSSTGSPVPLGRRGQVQQAVAEAEAITGASRALCREAIGAAWAAVLDDGPDIERAAARAQIAITHAMQESVRVVDRCFHAAGTNAISSANRLERFLRDAHTAVQHAAGQSLHLRQAAQTLLGLDGGSGPAVGAPVADR
ncbi:MAG: acyl-CoA dehydrogenase family protein [Actinomycetota bacterium]